MLNKSPVFAVGLKSFTRPKMAWQVWSNVNVMLTVCFECEGIICHEFQPGGQTVKKEYYLRVMKRLREAVRRKRPDLWRGKNGCTIMTMLLCICQIWFMVLSQNMRWCLSLNL